MKAGLSCVYGLLLPVQVVYALNTRNEEHESFIAALRITYDERARQAENNSAASLKEMEVRVRGACEEGEKRVKEVKKKMEEEREQLAENQVRLHHRGIRTLYCPTHAGFPQESYGREIDVSAARPQAKDGEPHQRAGEGQY